MREYKFRGKDLETKEWRHGSLMIKNNPHKIENVPWSYFIYDNALTQWQVDPETVGQHLGKIKSEESEIYEDDLIQHGETIRVVKFLYGNTHLVRQNGEDTILLSFSKSPVKLGNIHDNPELLK